MDSFDTLCGWLLARFADCKSIIATFASLDNVIQREREGLKQYMARFARAKLNTSDLHQAMSMDALLVGLHPEKFLDTLYVESPEDMDQLQARAARYMSIEENTDTHRRTMKAPTTTVFPNLRERGQRNLKATPP